jgi:MoaA/NifB/PqqE/SkfB family radical SAM enzyme
MAKKIGYTRVQVISNGRMFAYDNFLNTAVSSGLDEITFSIHGHTEKLHDFLTNTPGSFNESLKGLKNALKIKKLIVNIDVVINKRNVKYLKDILDYFMLLGVNEFDLLQVIPFGNAWENKQKLFYDIPKMLPYLKQVFRLSLNKCYHIWLNRFPPEYLETYEHLIQDPEKLYDEVGGRSKTFNAFIRNDEKIGCFGERCGYCYLKMFCQDLIALKKEGKLTQKIQYFCLPTEQYRHKKLVEFSVISKKRFNVMEYLNFFIHYRYNVKGLSCRRCFRDKTCDGVNINVIKKHGFKKLTLNF